MLVSMYSTVLVFDTVTTVVFYYACKPWDYTIFGHRKWLVIYGPLKHPVFSITFLILVWTRITLTNMKNIIKM
jgi:hypothetical protein